MCYENLDTLMHFPVVIVRSQFLAIGWQLKINSNDPRKEYMTVVVMTTHTAILNG
jgi:hypothetical protein